MISLSSACVVILVFTLTCTSESPASDAFASTGTTSDTPISTTHAGSSARVDATDSSTGEIPRPPSATIMRPVLRDDRADIDVLRVGDGFGGAGTIAAFEGPHGTPDLAPTRTWDFFAAS